MNETDSGTEPGGEQKTSALFASLVMQNTNMAVIFLGMAPNPQTGQTVQDLDNARYFIDQLEMLEVKTKGNLNSQEAALLNQSLTNLRMAFVEAVNHPRPGAAETAPEEPAAPPADEQETPIDEPPLPGEKTPPPPAAAETQSKKIFTKKYS